MAAMTLALARGATPLEALAWGVLRRAAAECAGTARMRRADVAARYRQLTQAAG